MGLMFSVNLKSVTLPGYIFFQGYQYSIQPQKKRYYLSWGEEAVNRFAPDQVNKVSLLIKAGQISSKTAGFQL